MLGASQGVGSIIACEHCGGEADVAKDGPTLCDICHWRVKYEAEKAEIERLRKALEAARIGHWDCIRHYADGNVTDCDCGADEHNAAIEKVLRGE